MKNNAFIAAVMSLPFLLVMFSCKKQVESPVKEPLTFGSIEVAHIKRHEGRMATTAIMSTNEEGIIWNTGDVFLYRTKSGAYGKFQVVEINHLQHFKLTLKAVTYAADGTVARKSDELVVKGTWSCDLDNLEEVTDDRQADFFWSRHDEAVTYFEPSNNARFVKFIAE